MYKNGVIQLGNWTKGMAVSPYSGFGKMINADIYSEPGVIKASTVLGQSGSMTITGTPNVTYLYGGATYIGTSTGKFYKNGILVHTSPYAIQDIAVYKDYVIITTAKDSTTLGNGGIDTYGPLSGGAVYTPDALDLASKPSYGYRKIVLNTTDPVNGIWIANEANIAIITSAFTGTADSGFSATKFALPNGRVATTICEFGDDLAIMTKFQNGNDFASIIFWDKGATYGSVVHLSETTSNQMLAMNNRLYYIGNDTGTLFEANKSSFIKIWSIQDRRSWQTFSNFQNAICIMQNQLLFGFAPGVTSYPDPVFYAVYAYQPGIGVSIRNTISTGNFGLTQGMSITSLQGQNQGVYYAGWLDGSNVGIDIANINIYATARIESALMEVGTWLEQKTFKTIEVNLGELFPAGSSIVVKSRQSKDAQFIAVRTLLQSEYGSVCRFQSSFQISDLTTVQFEVDLVPGTSNLTTPTLLSMLIK